MKYNSLLSLFFVLIIIVPQAVLSKDLRNSDSGFSGNLQGGAFYIQTDSQLLATDSDSINSTLDGPAEKYDEISPIASIYLNYQFESGTSVYVGNPLQVGEDLNLAAGVKQPLGQSTLDVAVTWLPIKEVWKNPYQTASPREKSDADVYGLRLKVLDFGGSPWEANETERSVFGR